MFGFFSRIHGFFVDRVINFHSGQITYKEKYPVPQRPEPKHPKLVIFLRKAYARQPLSGLPCIDLVYRKMNAGK